MRRARLPRLIMLAGALACGAYPALAAGAGSDWEIFGTNTVRGENYNARGNLAASPYQREGGKAYDEFAVNLQRRDSEYDVWRAQVYGVVNGSPYRAPDQGLVPERLNLSREKGDSALPHRWEVGDYFGYFSYRTLQRSLKGGTVELQPRMGSSADWRPSLIIVSGTPQPSWKNLDPQADYTNGASLLLQAPGSTRVIGNFLRNHRGADPTLGTLNRAQSVFSLGAEHVARWGPQQLVFEGEAGYFSGDHDGLTGPASGQNRSAHAYYGQLSGRRADMPLSYRLRAERNEQDYQPNGAVVTPDRRALEAHAGWNFDLGLTLRGRAQYFSDGLQTNNQTDTKTVGINLSGLLLPRVASNLTGTLDAYAQDIDKRDNTIDRKTHRIDLNISKPLDSGWVGRAGYFLQKLRDHVPGAADVSTSQISLSGDHAWRMGNFVGTLTPGIVLRFIRGGAGEADEVNPTLALSLVNGPHSIGFSYGLLAQQPAQRLVVTGATDVYTTQAAANYRFTRGQDTFGFEFDHFDRSPDQQMHTTAYRVSLFWTHSFEKTPAISRAPLVSDAVGTGAALPRSPAVLLALAPGTALDTQLKRLDDSGYRGGVTQPGAVVFEARLLDEIDQRQRLVLTHEAGSVVKSALIVELGSVGGAETQAQTFERVRRALLNRFGRPVTTFEEGNFGPALAADLSTGRFIRIMEWTTGQGRLRLGIPRRLDGQVRIEIQHAKRFPAPRDTLWSIETVR